MATLKCISGTHAKHHVCIVWLQRDINLLVTPLLMQYPVYKHVVPGPTALGLGACKPDIALTGV